MKKKYHPIYRTLPKREYNFGSWTRGELKRLYGMDKAYEVFLKALEGKDVIKITNKEE